MPSLIREFWKSLELSVHPEDARAFATYPHTFNLDFPPPAFVGDVDSAPVVILMLNGGYDPEKTPLEFPTPGDMQEHVQWLKGERKQPPCRLSSYYTEQNYIFEKVLSGHAVIVNACAYRSRKLRAEKDNFRLAEKHLQSVRIHQRWLREEVLPAARNGTRLIAAHRWGLWDFQSKVIPPAANVYYSRNPQSSSLPLSTRAAIASFLQKH
jgi:hypothetical protein